MDPTFFLVSVAVMFVFIETTIAVFAYRWAKLWADDQVSDTNEAEQ